MSTPLPRTRRHPVSLLRDLLRHEAAGGLILMAAAALAMAVANSGWSEAYQHALHIHVGGLSLLHWINDGLMAVFFLLVGLEIKRELLIGHLRRWSDRMLPGLAALGGMIVPAVLYAACNLGHAETLRGWAIPAATDIAFALGVLSLLGRRAPISLKLFLTALAILDDLGAIVIIALFYTAGLSPLMLAASGVVLVALLLLNRFGVMRLWPYLLLGLVLWVCVLQSGIHATVAGVVLAACIPLGPLGGDNVHDEHTPLHRLEHALHPAVAYCVLPIFGFANAGVALHGVDASALTEPVTLGIILGLFAGKQIGVFGTVWLAVRLRLAQRPAHAGWGHVYGVSLLCGVGFTMSLFIGLLAFADAPHLETETKIGVLTASLLSMVAGAGVLLLQRNGGARAS